MIGIYCITTSTNNGNIGNPMLVDGGGSWLPVKKGTWGWSVALGLPH